MDNEKRKIENSDNKLDQWLKRIKILYYLGIIVGLFTLNNTISKRETDVQLVELSVNLLQSDSIKNDSTEYGYSLREWAVETINQHSDNKLPEVVKNRGFDFDYLVDSFQNKLAINTSI